MPLSLRRLEDGALEVEGDLTREGALELLQRLESLPAAAGGTVTLDLYGLEVTDGVAAALAVDGIRALLRRGLRVVLRGAPQVLGHVLYRVGLLEEGESLELVELRQDEPYG